MKISRISVKLIGFALVFYVAWYCASVFSRSYEIEKARQIKEEYGFTILHGQEDLNYWDYAGIGFMVLGTSSVVAAVWLRNFDR